MSGFEGYTRKQVCALLGLPPEGPAQLAEEGLLSTTRVSVGKRLFAKPWVDDLKVLLGRYPPMGNRDQTLFELYALHRQYYHSSPGESRGQRDKHHARIKRACEQLVDTGRVWKLERLATEIGMPTPRLNRWMLGGRLSALRFGRDAYLTARYARHVVELFNEWKSIEELACESGMATSTIERRISSGRITSVMCADGMHRINPKAFREMLDGDEPHEPGVTPSEAARRIGCQEQTLNARVSEGGVRSTGWGKARRIPEEEVVRWEAHFHNLNPEFVWLQPIITPTGRTAATLTAQQALHILEVVPSTLTLWSQLGLLPFFPRSFLLTGKVERAFVRRYIVGLRQFAGGKVARQHAVTYKTLCQERGNIV